MKKIIKSLNEIPNADATLKALKKQLNIEITPKVFLQEIRTKFGEELYESTYTSWRGLKQRAQKLHAADGVPLSPKFQKFHDFVVCMGLRPCRSYTLDRKNGELGYTAPNCHWVDKKTQTENRSITAYAKDRNGQCETLSSWAAITGTPLKTLSKRKSNGWSDPDIIHGRTPAVGSASVSGRYRSYGSSARIDYSPSGDRWPPKTKTEWESALNSCGDWTGHDKLTALDYVKNRREGYGKLISDYVEHHCDEDGYLTPEQNEEVGRYSERIQYFTEWLKVAERAMFPRSFIPPNDIF